MKVRFLPKSCYETAKELNVNSILLAFSGGHDEGYLDVTINVNDDKNIKGKLSYLERDIEKWAWKVYDYCGTGEGIDYGHNITYDLINNKVEIQEWEMQRKYEDPVVYEMKTN